MDCAMNNYAAGRWVGGARVGLAHRGVQGRGLHGHFHVRPDDVKLAKCLCKLVAIMPRMELALHALMSDVTGNRDRVSQQIQHKLGDYHLAQSLIDDPSKSIGIYAEPASPAPCPPSRRENEFKKPAHAPQNGRVHHRPYSYSKSEVPGSTSAPAQRPPPLRIPNGFQTQNAIDSSQPPIESILKEMKSLPTPLSVIAATPRKELENKFIFNPYTNKVQENPQLTSNDLKTPLPKPGGGDGRSAPAIRVNCLLIFHPAFYLGAVNPNLPPPPVSGKAQF
ncbi:hypothetical protein ACJJTC_001865 [Scirpophaga incertulas]